MKILQASGQPASSDQLSRSPSGGRNQVAVLAVVVLVRYASSLVESFLSATTYGGIAYGKNYTDSQLTC